MKRKTLGLTSVQHKGSAKQYAIFYADAVSLARRDLKAGRCKVALDQIIMVAKSGGAMHAHHASRGRTRALRTARQSGGMQKMLVRLMDEYRSKCVR